MRISRVHALTCDAQFRCGDLAGPSARRRLRSARSRPYSRDGGPKISGKRGV